MRGAATTLEELPLELPDRKRSAISFLRDVLAQWRVPLSTCETLGKSLYEENNNLIHGSVEIVDVKMLERSMSLENTMTS